MSDNQLNVRQLRAQAKELLKTLPEGARLADAQHEVARRAGHESWPKLVAALETPALVERLKGLVEAGDADALDRLLRRKPGLRGRLNDPLFSFDSPSIRQAAVHREARRLLPVLVRHGANPNARSEWWAGGFSALDHASEDVAELLLSLGARWDVWSAAAHGRTDVLARLLDEDPSRVSAPGGDGMTPLHFAKDAPTAELLIARGADVNKKDVDHEGTPIQHQVGKPDVVRLLLAHGARPDAFTAAVLGDESLVAGDPEAPRARVGKPPFVTVSSDGGHIYEYTLGSRKTPQGVAAERGHTIFEGLSPSRDLVAAAWRGDAAAVERLKGAEVEPEDAVALAQAAQEGRVETARLLLDAGFDPLAKGMDSGTALHVACWFGHLSVVRLLVDRVPLELPDDHHGSPPLGWACHGATWCRNPKGDYPGVVRALLEAGADPKAPANRGGTPMLAQAGDREDVKAVLREYGA